MKLVVELNSNSFIVQFYCIIGIPIISLAIFGIAKMLLIQLGADKDGALIDGIFMGGTLACVHFYYLLEYKIFMWIYIAFAIYMLINIIKYHAKRIKKQNSEDIQK